MYYVPITNQTNNSLKGGNKMAKYGVNLPIVGYVYIEVEAENETESEE